MAGYFKRRWTETRGDEHNDWGQSWWLIETDDELWPTRQIEHYDGGVVLMYDSSHLNDEYGGLGDQPLDAEEFADYQITAQEFANAWNTLRPINYPGRTG